jgi:hypothetical protein
VTGSSVHGGYGVREVVLIVNIKNMPTGTTPAIVFKIEEVDPGDETTVLGTSIVGVALTAIGTQILRLQLLASTSVKVTWTITGTTPSFSGVYATLVGKFASSAVTLYDSNGNEIAGNVLGAGLSRIVAVRLLNAGSEIMTVDGSVTPKVFSFPADATDDIFPVELRLMFVDNTTPFGENKFGTGSALTNGLLFEVISNGVLVQVGNVKVNDDFYLLTPATQARSDQVGAFDWISVGINLANTAVLKAATSDVVRITVRDDLTATNYLRASCSGYKAL